ncbi:MAG TPA: ABC transporter ATP-binding protein [Planctomycetota bacterium]|jgi:ATP-binding cassette subfamily B protein|nr:ABC transporter ATP-binding protein [Planctomycetota bacterium]
MIDPREEDDLGRDYDRRLMGRFLTYVRPYRGLVVLAFLLLVLRIGVDLLAPLIFWKAVDGPLAAGDYPRLLRFAGWFSLAVAGTALFEFLYSWTTNYVGQNIILDLRMQLFSHLQRLSIAFFDRNPVGRLLVRVTNDVENLNELFTSGLVEFAADLLMLSGAIAMLFYTDVKLAAVTMMVTPFIFLATWLFRNTARRKYREMRTRIARLNSYLNESVNGMRTIQTFGRERACLERFRTLNAEHCDSAVSAIFSYSIFYPGIECLFSLTVAVVAGAGGLMILDHSLSVGAFLAFWYYIHKFTMPIREIAEKYNILQAAMASSERVFKILDTAPEVAERRPAETPAPPLPEIRGEVAFENVSFSYDGKTPVLENLSFRIEPGRSLAIVGLTGAGKSTVINLLMRFYDPVGGRITVDGRDLRDYDLASLRRRMGLVLQDVFVFAGTIEDNIRLGDRGIDRARVEQSARAVNADRFIGRMPKGFESPVLERGAALSTGERQLLSFARALAFDPRILVLDEATSSVDGQTERLIQDGLLRLMKGRTSLVIAHRLSTIQHADRILVLHRGRVREEGTHEDLLKQDGMYRKLYRLQFHPAEAPKAALAGGEGAA